MENTLSCLFKAASIHNSIKKELLDSDFINPNTSLINICDFIENRIRKRSHVSEYNNGIAFPTGVSLNNTVAHWTPLTKYDKTILSPNDVLKIDYGVHVNGCIIDSAFTINLNPLYNPLLEASKEAVDVIIKECGVDSSASELGALSEEVISSYEIDINGTMVPIKPINNVCGHNIRPWNIHGGKLFPGSNNNDTNTRIQDQDILAIEVFTSTGNGVSYLSGQSSHFMLNDSAPIDPKYKKFYKIIYGMFKTLPFCQRFIDYNDLSLRPYQEKINEGIRKGYIKSYPPLVELDKNARVAQFEHTIYVSETKKIQFTE